MATLVLNFCNTIYMNSLRTYFWCLSNFYGTVYFLCNFEIEIDSKDHINLLIVEPTKS